MPPRTLDRSQCRQLDRRAMEEYGISGLVLMENAGRGVADKLSELGIGGPVVICCGRGNNGGDGFVVARHLDLRGYPVRVLLWAEPDRLSGDAATNFGILQKTDVPIECFAGAHAPAGLEAALAGAAWAVDALLGTGARGEPRAPLDAVIDPGQAARHAVRAAHTCTFAAPKPGFFLPGAERYTGRLHVLDIGAPRKLLDDMFHDR